MIRDFEHIDAPNAFACDLCIIGGGAAGISLALEFLDTSHEVILVESGGLNYEDQTQDLYSSEVEGLEHQGVHAGRARIFGGTTTLWAGQSLPLDALDFRERPWVSHSGWPFSRDELSPYYQRAARIMNVDRDRTYDIQSWPAELSSPPTFDDEKFRFLYSQFSPAPNFADTYHELLNDSSNITVLLHANAVDIKTSREGTAVERLEIKTLSGREGVVKARFFVLCCGGIENARLLLAFDDTSPNGLGNQHGLVGRFFQEHVHVHVPVYPTDSKGFSAQFNSVLSDNVRFYPKIASTPALQRHHQIGNVVVDLAYEIDPQSAVESAKRLWNPWTGSSPRSARETISDLSNVIRHPIELARALGGYLLKGHKLSETGSMYLSFQAESQPNPESRICLSKEIDALGMPRTVLDWHISPFEIRTVQTFIREVDHELRRHDLGHLDKTFLDVSYDSDEIEAFVHDSNHHMGTTRMHTDPEQGVVNADCRLHTVNNVFIGGSSVFPTSGHSNPTLTIIALCIRMADHLKTLMR